MTESTNLVRVEIRSVPTDPQNGPPLARDDDLIITGCASSCATYPSACWPTIPIPTATR